MEYKEERDSILKTIVLPIRDNYDINDCTIKGRKYIEKDSADPDRHGKKKFDIFNACSAKTGKCNLVLKILKYSDEQYNMCGTDLCSFKYIKEAWMNEVGILALLDNRLNKYEKSVPKLIDAWYCEEETESHFYIVMEKYDGDLATFLKKIKVTEDEKKQIMKKLKKLKKALKKVHDLGICLADIKEENILYREVKNKYEFVFTDFGISFYREKDFKNKNQDSLDKCKQREMDNFDKVLINVDDNLKLE